MKTKIFFLRDIVLSIFDLIIVVILAIEIIFFMTVMQESITVNQLLVVVIVTFLTIMLGKFLGTYRRVKNVTFMGKSHPRLRQKIENYFSVDQKIED